MIKLKITVNIVEDRQQWNRLITYPSKSLENDDGDYDDIEDEKQEEDDNEEDNDD